MVADVRPMSTEEAARANVEEHLADCAGDLREEAYILAYDAALDYCGDPEESRRVAAAIADTFD